MPNVSINQAMQLAIQHHQAGRLEEAERLYRHVLGHRPNHADAFHLLGVLAGQLGRAEDAAGLMRRAIELNPAYADAYSNLGAILHAQGQWAEAVAVCQKSIALKPDHALAWYNLANVLKDQGKLDEALDAYQRAIRLSPNLAQAHSNMGNTLKEQGELDAAIACHARAVSLRPNDPLCHSNQIYTMLFHPNYDAAAIFAAHREWNDRHAAAFKTFMPHPNDRNPDRRLKIGYVSPDFRDHVVGRNLFPLFQKHDRSQFEIHCYANVLKPDSLTARYRAFSDNWRSIVGNTDEQVAELVRRDQIDILIDLSLHTENTRLMIFARKPAPVQVTFAGYPGSTGLGAMDYRLTDPYLDPPNQSDEFYSEQSIRLADSFWCYEPEVMAPGTAQMSHAAELPAPSAGRVTFGCLNNFCKVNDNVLAAWAQVLNAVRESRLVLIAPEGNARQRILQMLGQNGIEPTRIEFVGRMSSEKYLSQYNRIDIVLDTFPYNGHTTSLDALWVGVPVVTLVGKTVVGRAGLSQLTNLKLTELIATSEEQYVKIAADLASDLPRLGELRANLRQRMRESPLTDAPKFARNIESAYRQMWRRWCEGAGQEARHE
jgi:predicted O-linked N-acetylglucosamine transferase (SPINDLY family)